MLDVQAVRTEQDTEAVLNSWASSPDAQECPDILHMIEDDGPFDALEKLEECIQMFKPKCASIRTITTFEDIRITTIAHIHKDTTCSCERHIYMFMILGVLHTQAAQHSSTHSIRHQHETMWAVQSV